MPHNKPFSIFTASLVFESNFLNFLWKLLESKSGQIAVFDTEVICKHWHILSCCCRYYCYCELSENVTVAFQDEEAVDMSRIVHSDDLAAVGDQGVHTIHTEINNVDLGNSQVVC